MTHVRRKPSAPRLGPRSSPLVITLTALFCSLGALTAGSQTLWQFIASPDFRSLADYTEHVTFWRQRFDINGDRRFDTADLLEFVGRKGTGRGETGYHAGFELTGDDRVGNDDITLFFDLVNRFPMGYDLAARSDPPRTIAAYYPWYEDDASWDTATSIPRRGRYLSLDPVVYAQQRLEAHAAGIDIFAVSTFRSDRTRRFHAMQDALEQTKAPALTTFLWLYEILGRLPWILNSDGKEIVDFDSTPTRQAFVDHMVELAQYFHANYLILDGRFHPIWIWKTDTIRGDFVGAVIEARQAVRQRYGKDLVIIGGELAQFPHLEAELQKRLPAFFGMTHYGMYTPLFTQQYGGQLSFSHTDFTMSNLLGWIRIVRDQGRVNIYGRPMEYWPPLQFGFDDRGVPGRNNPTMSATREQLEYYVQQLDRMITVPNQDIVRFWNHTSYNEHFEGHGLEPTVGYNGGRAWLQINNVYRGPTRTYRQLIVTDPELQRAFADRR